MIGKYTGPVPHGCVLFCFFLGFVASKLADWKKSWKEAPHLGGSEVNEFPGGGNDDFEALITTEQILRFSRLFYRNWKSFPKRKAMFLPIVGQVSSINMISKLNHR